MSNLNLTNKQVLTQESIEAIFDHVLEEVPNIKVHLDDLQTISFNHIYNDLITILSMQYDVDDLSKLDEYFSNSQKVLQACKVANFAFASKLIKSIDTIIDQLRPEVATHMGLIYYPMLAYYYYAKKNYSIAISQLNYCIELINLLSLNSHLNLVSTKIDQKLNTVIVLFSMEKYQRGFRLGQEIILFLLQGKIGKHFNHNNHEEYEQMAEKDKLKLIQYVISGYTRRVIYLIKKDPQNEIYFLTHSFSKLWGKENSTKIHNRDLHLSLLMLKYYCYKRPSHFIWSITDYLHKCDRIPKLLQFLIFERIILFAKKLGYSKYGQLLHTIDQHYTNKINLKI